MVTKRNKRGDPKAGGAAKPVQAAAAPEIEFVVAVMRTADLVTQSIERVLKPSGLTGQQFNVLRILRGEQRRDAESHGLMCSQIAQRMITRDPDITRLLDRLETAGLIERHRCPEDRRRVLTRISRKGLAALAELDGPVARHHADFSILPRADLARMTSLLEALCKKLGGETADAAAPAHDEK
jgi:DNA-binding MarR family transcriptional regulator